MAFQRTAVTALSVELPSPPGIDAGAFWRLARSQMNDIPRAVCFPRDDPQFAERVQDLLDGSDSDGPFAAAVQALLRETHPLAVIAPRNGLAALDRRRVWYAFRDGSAVPSVNRETS
jgi:hypothetical protein